MPKTMGCVFFSIREVFSLHPPLQSLFPLQSFTFSFEMRPCVSSSFFVCMTVDEKKIMSLVDLSFFNRLLISRFPSFRSFPPVLLQFQELFNTRGLDDSTGTASFNESRPVAAVVGVPVVNNLHRQATSSTGVVNRHLDNVATVKPNRARMSIDRVAAAEAGATYGGADANENDQDGGASSTSPSAGNDLSSTEHVKRFQVNLRVPPDRFSHQLPICTNPCLFI